jgi:hypothetical protein
MPRLIFVNRFFHPDTSATSQILGDLAFHLAEAGFDVQVVSSCTSPPSPTSGNPSTSRELYYDNNTGGTLRLLRPVAQSEFTSTCATYGEPETIPIPA